MRRGDGAFATSAIQQVALLVSGVGSVWLIGETGRGQLAYGMTCGTLAGLVAAGGWSPTAALALARHWGSRESVLGQLLRVALYRASLAIPIAGLGLLAFTDELGSNFVPVFVGAVLNAVGQVAIQLLVGIAQGLGKAMSANLLRASVSVAYALPLVVLGALQFGFGSDIAVSTVAWSWAASWSLPSIAGLVLVRRYGQSRPVVGLNDRRLIGRMKRNSRQSFLGTISLYELLRADQVLAILVLPTAGVGHYVVATSFTGFLKTFGQALGVSVLASTVKAADGRRRWRLLLGYGALIVAVAVAVSVAMWPVFRWVLPSEFAGARSAAVILIATAAVSAWRRILVEFAKGLEAPLGGSIAEAGFATVMVGAVVLGVVDRSVTGVAIATLMGASCAVVVALAAAVLASRRSNVK